jgi:D-glycero-D-manno-heptose 1,7-bisphosphate phosphatase
MNRAIYFDRDGTIIKDKGFIKHEKDVEFYDCTFESLNKLQKHFLLFVITNQPGIAKGLLTQEMVENINSFILARLKKRGIIIQELYCCPHRREDGCICRKPNTHFIKQSVNKYLINTTASFVIGDHPSDIQLALNSGAKGIYLLSGHGRKHRREIQYEVRNKIYICQNLKNAARLIMSLNDNNYERRTLV